MNGFNEVSALELEQVDGGGLVTDALTGTAAGLGVCAAFPSPASAGLAAASIVVGLAAYVTSKYNL